MIDADVLKRCLDQHRGTLIRLAGIETELNARFYNMQEPVRALILAALSGEPLLFIGPPGTAKSNLIRSFCELIGVTADQRTEAGGYFEYLLTPFTEPSELFGYYDIGLLHKQGVMQRLDSGMMQHAEVVFLDEVFNASSAILNAILAVMNERVFHDRGRAQPVALKCLFGATNDIPRTEDLMAVFDRFLLRCRIDNVMAEPGEVEALVGVGWQETYGTGIEHHPEPGILDDLEKLRADLGGAVGQPDPADRSQRALFGNLSFQIGLARQYGAAAMSNRRVIKLIYVLVLHALYRAAAASGNGQGLVAPATDELSLVPRFFLDHVDPVVIDKMQRLPYPMT